MVPSSLCLPGALVLVCPWCLCHGVALAPTSWYAHGALFLFGPLCHPPGCVYATGSFPLVCPLVPSSAVVVVAKRVSHALFPIVDRQWIVRKVCGWPFQAPLF